MGSLFSPSLIEPLVIGVLVQIATYRQLSETVAVDSRYRGWRSALIGTALVQLIGVPVSLAITASTGSGVTAVFGASMAAIVVLSIYYRSLASGILLLVAGGLAAFAIGALAGVHPVMPAVVAGAWIGALIRHSRRTQTDLALGQHTGPTASRAM